MKINVLYFALLRDAMGVPREEVVVPDTVTTVGELRQWLVARGEPAASAFANTRRIRAALDQTMCADSALLHDDAEVAFFPPVTGG